MIIENIIITILSSLILQNIHLVFFFCIFNTYRNYHEIIHLN